MKGRKPDLDRAAEIKRLYSAGWPIVAIAHQLGCGETLIGYHLQEKNGAKAKTGPKGGMPSYHAKPGKNLPEEQIDEIYGVAKYENWSGREWL